MAPKILVTSALPYVNNLPHLGNLIQVLSADVFARYCRQRGWETLYVCGTDEYGTATETRALEEGVTPKELCDRYYAQHAEIYRWFAIAFDKFGRTSTPEHTAITQEMFLKLDAAGYVTEKTTSQLFCEKDQRFLADRYVRGTCPNCGYTEARGDQCENCGKLLDPTQLIGPRCSVCGTTPVARDTRHLYIDLPKILPRLESWMEHAATEGFWSHNAIQMTKSWIRDGLHERAITRDLKWGIPVPKEGFRDKVFYVWFDAPIGYLSITASLTDGWRDWWRAPDDVRLFQFIGKDNIPFHTVIFPSTLLGTGERWTMLHHMSSSEYLNYEGGQFSKSRGVGVFGNDAMETGIPADVWRFYLYYNRPEKSDALFTWQSFQEQVNGELIGNLANLVNRTLTFVLRNFEGAVPAGAPSPLHDEAVVRERTIGELLERAELRDAFRELFALSSLGNKAFQDGEPWKTVKSDLAAAGALLCDLTYLVRDLAILLRPFLPVTASRIAQFLRFDALQWQDPFAAASGSWELLGRWEGLGSIMPPELLFKRLEDDEIGQFRSRFAGSQKERAERERTAEQSLPQRFAASVDLRVAQVLTVDRHPTADKLYVETVQLGGDERRSIVSGLVPYYAPEELVGRKVLLVYNLKPAKLRGVVSEGMLLAAESDGSVEVLFADSAAPGDRVLSLPGDAPAPPPEITIDALRAIPLRVEDHELKVGEASLTVHGNGVRTARVANGEVG